MPCELRFSFPLVNGLHARPASLLQEVVGRFEASVGFVNDRNGREANASSVLTLVGTDTRQGDACRLVIAGTDENAARKALETFINGGLLRSDEPAAVENAPASGVVVPRILRAAGLKDFYEGTIACRGIGQGRIVRAGSLRLPPELKQENAGDPAVEQGKFDAAAAALRREMEEHLRGCAGVEAAVLKTHVAILRDATLSGKITSLIKGGATAAQAVVEAIDVFSETLRSAESAYLQERVLDLADISSRLLEKIYGPSAAPKPIVLTEPSILVAENLTPGQLLALDLTHLRGLVLGHGGTTSHTVILARARGVPTLTGLSRDVAGLRAGGEAVVDAHLGLLVVAPNQEVRRYYEREQRRLRVIEEGRAKYRNQLANTADGRRLEIAANIASAPEASEAFAKGAEGIGLFRTEMLFMDRDAAPGEEAQYEIYAEVARAAGKKAVIIRTFDIGGDKPVSYLAFPEENNPFLGYRGVRCYEEHAGLLKTQFRAILRAAAHGVFKIMIPMISSVEEVRQCRRLLAEAREELRAAGTPHGEKVPLGIMLEVPSVAFVMDELCAEADFFSIGSNDLTQYFLAVDRENEKVAPLYSSFHPGFIRLLKQLAESARRHNRWIGLCGELAENPEALPLFVALGLDEISLAAPRIGATKEALSKLDTTECMQLLERVLRTSTREEISQELTKFHSGKSAAPLLTADLVVIDSDSRSKEEVIREMAGALHAAGRTERPELIEEAVWQREDTYSTGFGQGLAVPHCKSDELKVNSIVIVRLREPVAWQSSDGEPVKVAIMLAVRAGEHGQAHMKTFARLSRLLMRDDFGTLLREEKAPAKLAAGVSASLDGFA